MEMQELNSKKSNILKEELNIKDLFKENIVLYSEYYI